MALTLHFHSLLSVFDINGAKSLYFSLPLLLYKFQLHLLTFPNLHQLFESQQPGVQAAQNGRHREKHSHASLCDIAHNVICLHLIIGQPKTAASGVVRQGQTVWTVHHIQNKSMLGNSPSASQAGLRVEPALQPSDSLGGKADRPTLIVSQSHPWYHAANTLPSVVENFEHVKFLSFHVLNKSALR